MSLLAELEPFLEEVVSTNMSLLSELVEEDGRKSTHLKPLRPQVS